MAVAASGDVRARERILLSSGLNLSTRIRGFVPRTGFRFDVRATGQNTEPAGAPASARSLDYRASTLLGSSHRFSPPPCPFSFFFPLSRPSSLFAPSAPRYSCEFCAHDRKDIVADGRRTNTRSAICNLAGEGGSPRSFRLLGGPRKFKQRHRGQGRARREKIRNDERRRRVRGEKEETRGEEKQPLWAIKQLRDRGRAKAPPRGRRWND